MYITQWKYSNQNSSRELSDHFHLSIGTAYYNFIRRIKAISRLKAELIKFPAIDQSQPATMEQFGSSRAYYNRKGQYSFVVQAIAHTKIRFTDVFVGYPGRCRDASIWRNSPMRQVIINKTLKISVKCHLLGDDAYPLETFLIIPYKGNGYLTQEQKIFIYMPCSTRVFIKQALAILKKKKNESDS
uniref:DDE Tnp4 domain-containing protein n=1 Tax=Bactrocera latifrons TaxID=174628 RepID=A0A0K8UQL5_BACLA